MAWSDRYLSYSGRKTYLTCPAKYQHVYVLKTPASRDARGSLFGTCIGKVFEWFYERSWWKAPSPVNACLGSIEESIEYAFKKESYDYHSNPDVKPSLEEELRKFIPPGLEVIRSNGFLTPMTRAEADLTVVYNSKADGFTIKLGGRADFIHGRNREDITILDGKASKHREQYVDSEQLIWYAMQHYLKYAVMPVRLGFLFWSFPDNPMGWIEFTPEDVRASLNKTIEVSKKIALKMFDPKPSSECERCEFRTKCDEGTKWVARRRIETGGRIDVEASVFDFEIVN